MEHMYEKKFPLNSKDYKLYEEVGEGVSASVYRALCIPLNEIVAIKVLDLEKCNNDFDGIRREVQTMTLINHPNVLRAHCSFAADSSLWVVMPYMAGGSCLHIMKSSHSEGLEETVIAILLREVLKALVYLHSQGHIHRDVKAGNILIDSNGTVKLADFGVSACMFDTGDRQRSRNTFVGTPCWMAPEVMQQLHGYDFKADIWSFGITALELAHGHAPFSKYPPMKVLLMTLQNAPPGLDYERDKRFSKSFKEMVAACLVKDPKKRPTSEKLLKHSFFKTPRTTEYLTKSILNGLPPLGDRFRMLKTKEADFLVQNKAMYGDKEHLSQQEYIRGISAWNFNLEDLKTQAALIQDFDDVSFKEDHDASSKQKDGCDAADFSPEPSPKNDNHSNVASVEEGELNDLQNVENSLASFPTLPLQALKGYFDVGEDDVNANGSSGKDSTQAPSQPLQSQLLTGAIDQETKTSYSEALERNSSFPKLIISGQRPKYVSGSVLPENVLSPYRKVNGNADREYMQPKYQPDRNYSGPLFRQKKDDDNHTSEDIQEEGKIVQRGRFKVTLADLNDKAATNNTSNQFAGVSSPPTTYGLATGSLLPSLQYILLQNNIQREQILQLIQFLVQNCGHSSEFTDSGSTDLPQASLASARERELQGQVIHLEQSIGSSVEELQRLKTSNAQLQRQLSASSNKDEQKAQTDKQS